MLIHGKERKFLYTVKASEELSDLCKDGDLANVGELIESGTLKERVNAIVDIIQILNRGYEEAKAFEDPGHVVDIIEKEELKVLPFKVLKDLEMEAFNSIKADSQTTVEVEEEKN